MPKNKRPVETTRTYSRRQASKEALKQMQLLLDDEEDDAFVIPDEEEKESRVEVPKKRPVSPIMEPPPKKKYKLSHRKSSDGNDRDVIVLKSISNSNYTPKEDTLELECYVEELSDVQNERRKKGEEEEKELESKLNELIKDRNAEVVFSGQLSSAVEVNEIISNSGKRTIFKPNQIPQIVSVDSTEPTYQLLLDPRLGLIIGTVQKPPPPPPSPPVEVTPPAPAKSKIQISSAVKAVATLPRAQSPPATRNMRTRRGAVSTPPTPVQTRGNSSIPTRANSTLNNAPTRSNTTLSTIPTRANSTVNAVPTRANSTLSTIPTRSSTGMPTRASISTPNKGNVSTPSKAAVATPSKATVATPSKATVATPSKATVATPSKGNIVNSAKGNNTTNNRGNNTATTRGNNVPSTRSSAQVISNSSPPPTPPPAIQTRAASKPSVQTRNSKTSAAFTKRPIASVPAEKPKQVVDLTAEDNRNQVDNREISFNKLQGKTYPSLVVVARPHLRVSNLGADRSKLDSKVKSVLMHPPTKFTEWLIQQGLIRSEQKCPVHSSTQLKLGMYSDVSKFPFSGGYVWISECCPQRFISVFSGSIFEGSPHPPMVMLKLIYHWSCQTNIQNVTQWVKVDNLYVKGVYTWLRGLCTMAVQTRIRQLGGPGCRVEVGVISLGTTSHDGNQRQVKVEVLGILESSSKSMKLRAVEPMPDGDRNFRKKFSKILEPILRWVHPASTIVTDLTVDKSTLNQMGFMNVIQTTSNDYSNSNRTIMEYLRRIVPRMFQNTLSLLSRQIIQQFLDELVWREWFGTTAQQAFDNILAHLAEQTRLNTNPALVIKLNKVAANPFKFWGVSGGSETTTTNVVTTTTNTNTVQTSNSISAPAKTPVAEVKRYGRGRKSNSPQVQSVQERPAKPVSPDVPEQMVPLENYYYGIIESFDTAPPKVTLSLKCPFCKLTFDNNLQLQNHLFKHAHDVSNDAYLCRYCLTSLSTANELLNHVNKCHPAETKFDNGFVCLICETHYMNPFVLGKHMSKEHCPHELPYECGSCSFRCSNHKQIIDHFYQRHDGGRSIQCPFCLKSTTVWSGGRNIAQNMHYFIQHLQKHQKKQLAKRCGKCNLWFVQKEVLKEHQQKMHVSLRGRLGLVPNPSPRNGVMVPKSKVDKNPCDAEIINFSSLYYNIPSKSVCKECDQVISSPKHFPSFDSCQNPNCQYSTCCATAMMTHNAKCKGLNSIIPPENLPFTMFCVCGHSDSDGNSMAKHLAICEKKSAYSSEAEAKSATVMHSMLDILGLVRKPEEAIPKPKEEEKKEVKVAEELPKVVDDSNAISILSDDDEPIMKKVDSKKEELTTNGELEGDTVKSLKSTEVELIKDNSSDTNSKVDDTKADEKISDEIDSEKKISEIEMVEIDEDDPINDTNDTEDTPLIPTVADEEMIENNESIEISQNVDKTENLETENVSSDSVESAANNETTAETPNLITDINTDTSENTTCNEINNEVASNCDENQSSIKESKDLAEGSCNEDETEKPNELDDEQFEDKNEKDLNNELVTQTNEEIEDENEKDSNNETVTNVDEITRNENDENLNNELMSEEDKLDDDISEPIAEVKSEQNSPENTMESNQDRSDIDDEDCLRKEESVPDCEQELDDKSDKGDDENAGDTENSEILAETENSEILAETENSEIVAETENSEILTETENSEIVAETENSEILTETENSEILAETDNEELTSCGQGEEDNKSDKEDDDNAADVETQAEPENREELETQKETTNENVVEEIPANDEVDKAQESESISAEGEIDDSRLSLNEEQLCKDSANDNLAEAALNDILSTSNSETAMDVDLETELKDIAEVSAPMEVD